MKQISINEALSFAYATLKKHAALLLIPGFIIGLFSSFVSFSIQSDIPQNRKILDTILTFFKSGDTLPYGLIIALLLLILFVVISLNVTIGFLRIGIQAYDGTDEDLSWNIYNQFGKGILNRYFLGSIVVGLITYCGLLILIIPGLIFFYMFYFTEYILVEKKVRISEALEMSNRITNGAKWPLFGNSLLIGLLVAIFFIPMFMFKFWMGFYYYPVELIILPIVSTFFTLVFIYFYKDLSDQQSYLEKRLATTEDPQPPIPLEMLMHRD